MATAITAFREKILPHVPGCPFFKVDEAIMDAIIEFCEDTHILRKGFWVDSATATTPSVVFPFVLPITFGASSSTSFGVITVTLSTYYTGYDPIVVTWFKMDGASYGLYNMAKPENYSSIDDFNTGGYQYKLFGFSTSATMELYPFDIGETHDFFIQIAVKPQSTSTTVDDIFYRDWERAIRYLAISNLQEIPEEKWSNERLADKNLNRYRGEMGRAKLRVANGMVNGESNITGGYF